VLGQEFGIKLGGNLSKYGGFAETIQTGNSKFLLGWQGGFWYRKPITEKLGIGIEVMAIRGGATTEYQQYQYTEKEPVYYISVPLLATYQANDRFMFELGLANNIALDNKAKKYIAGVVTGVNMSLRDDTWLNLRYEHGINQATSRNGWSVYTRSLQLSLYFRLGAKR
jgi:Outer membrane protein beta-barrel domain